MESVIWTIVYMQQFERKILRFAFPGHLQPVMSKPVGQMSILGEFHLPEVVPGVPPRTILHFKTRGCRLLARKRLGIPRTEKWSKIRHAGDWVVPLFTASDIWDVRQAISDCCILQRSSARIAEAPLKGLRGGWVLEPLVVEQGPCRASRLNINTRNTTTGSKSRGTWAQENQI